MSLSRSPNAYVRFAQFIGNYRYYRKLGFHPRESWRLAGLTLPT